MALAGPRRCMTLAVELDRPLLYERRRPNAASATSPVPEPSLP